MVLFVGCGIKLAVTQLSLVYKLELAVLETATTQYNKAHWCKLVLLVC